jgi:cold shock protein
VITHCGTVRSVKIDKGYGFISRPNGEKDLFFHVKSLDPSLPFDEQLRERRVQFEMINSDRGPRAENVRPV